MKIIKFLKINQAKIYQKYLFFRPFSAFSAFSKRRSLRGRPRKERGFAGIFAQIGLEIVDITQFGNKMNCIQEEKLNFWENFTLFMKKISANFANFPTPPPYFVCRKSRCRLRAERAECTPNRAKRSGRRAK